MSFLNRCRSVRCAAFLVALTPALAAVGQTTRGEVLPYDEAQPAAGMWVGGLQAGSVESHAVVRIEHTGEGWSVWTTTRLVMAIGVPAREVDIDGRSLVFEVKTVAVGLRFEGAISKDGQTFGGDLSMTDSDGKTHDGSFQLQRYLPARKTENHRALVGRIDAGGMGLELTLNVGQTPNGRWVADLDVPMQGLEGFPLSDVEYDNDRFKATLIGPPDAVFEGVFEADGSVFKGSMIQGGMKLPLEMSVDGSLARGPDRPQNPTPPYPYEVREFSVEHQAGYTLAGTLTMPTGPGPHPVAVLISGSGPQDRDETVFNHKPFWVLADHLTRAGIGVARYDDRGVASSSGADTLAGATTAGYADDTKAIVAFLRATKGVDASRVGLVGHSEGGIIAAMVAAADPSIAFVVSMAGTAVPGREVLIRQNRLMHAVAGIDEAALDAIETAQRRALDLVVAEAETAEIREAIRDLVTTQIEAAGQPMPTGEQLERAIDQHTRGSANAWMRFFIEHDPRDDLRRVRCPVLAINGTLDLQVHHEQNLPEFSKALRSGGGRVTVKAFEGLNHLFQPATTGAIQEYGVIETTIAPSVLEEIASWVTKVVTSG